VSAVIVLSALSAVASNAATVTVSAPSLVQTAGQTFTVAITLNDPSNAGVGSFQFGLDYDPTVMTWQSCTKTGTILPADQNPTCNSITTADPHVSTMLVSDFGTTGTSGNGIILNISFKATSTAPFPKISPLHFHDAFFFTTTQPLTVITVDGSVQVNLTTAASVAVAGRVTDALGGGVRGARVTLTSSNGTVSVLSNSFGYYSFTAVPSGASYTASVSARGLSFAPVVINLRSAVSDLNFSPR